MIKNESHFRKRQVTLLEYQTQLNKLLASDLDKNSIQFKSDGEALSSLIEEIEDELLEYEDYKNGDKTNIICKTFSNLSDMLIKARIAKGLTQEELAEKADLHAQQIQKYEANDYQEVKFGTLTQIASALDINDKFYAVVNLLSNEQCSQLGHLQYYLPQRYTSEDRIRLQQNISENGFFSFDEPNEQVA